MDESGVVDQDPQNAVVSSDFTQGFLDKVYEETSVKPLAFRYDPSRDSFLNKPLNSLVDAAFTAAQLALDGAGVAPTHGICASTPEATARNMGLIASPGMAGTERTILDIMRGKA